MQLSVLGRGVKLQRCIVLRESNARRYWQSGRHLVVHVGLFTAHPLYHDLPGDPPDSTHGDYAAGPPGWAPQDDGIYVDQVAFLGTYVHTPLLNRSGV